MCHLAEVTLETGEVLGEMRPPGFTVFGRSPDAFVGGDGVHGVLDVGDLRWSVLVQVSPE